LRQQLQSLGEEVGGLLRRAGDVPAGPREARHQPDAHGIDRVRQNDRYRLRHVLDGQRGRRRRCDDQVEVESSERGGKLRKSLRASVGVPTLHDEVLSLHVPEFPELLKEGFIDRHGRDGNKADPPYLRRLLRLGGERRGEEAEGENQDPS
jgi:hypothetical protein